MAVFTRARAEKAGWSFRPSDDGTMMTAAHSGTGKTISVAADAEAPVFLLLANIAERRGTGFLVGYGGSRPITPELVEEVSGETWTPPDVVPDAAPPPPSTLTDVVRGLDEALASQETGASAEVLALIQAIRAVTSQI